MSKSAVYILNFKVLYNIISEIKNFFNFDLLDFDNEIDLLKELKKRGDRSFIVLTKGNLNNTLIDKKQIIKIVYNISTIKILNYDRIIRTITNNFR